MIYVMTPIVNADPPTPDAAGDGPILARGERDEGLNEEITQVRAVYQAPGLLRRARRWAEQGRAAEALPLAEDATRLYRRLARADPEIYLPDLVRALIDVGTLRSYTSWESAVAPAQEATRIYRQLTRARVVVPEVAGSLSNLLAFLWETAADASRLTIPNPEGVGMITTETTPSRRGPS